MDLVAHPEQGRGAHLADAHDTDRFETVSLDQAPNQTGQVMLLEDRGEQAVDRLARANGRTILGGRG